MRNFGVLSSKEWSGDGNPLYQRGFSSGAIKIKSVVPLSLFDLVGYRIALDAVAGNDLSDLALTEQKSQRLPVAAVFIFHAFAVRCGVREVSNYSDNIERCYQFPV